LNAAGAHYRVVMVIVDQGDTKMKTTLWPWVLVLCCCAGAHAADYDEALQGDLPFLSGNDPGSGPQLALQFGTNHLRGSTFVSNVGSDAQIDRDTLLFSMPANTALLSLSVTAWLGAGDGPVSALGWTWREAQGSSPAQWTPVPGTGPLFWGSASELALSGMLFGSGIREGQSRTVFYDVTFVIGDIPPWPVPEPASLLMMGTGLAALGLAAARRRTGST
jgi:hypothetical protein